MDLEFSEAAKAYILQSIDSNQYGARPLRRKLESVVENKIATIIIGAEEKQLTRIIVDVKEGEIEIKGF